MATRADIEEWVYQAVKDLGEASPARVAEHVWKRHEADLKSSGDLFYTWQYDTRWAAQRLQGQGKLQKTGRTWKFIR